MSKTTKMTLEQVVTKIKGLITQTALAKIEIGELLTEYTSTIKRGGKTEFYKLIGMSSRTAQHYMKIASNKEIQKLKREGKLEGLNMTEILECAGIRTQDIKPKNKIEYEAVATENFNYMSCKSTKILKVQYAVMENKVSELKSELELAIAVIDSGVKTA